ncbi:hypothetical protein C8R41DRAFT_914582 [Lentinula lateritia]|uniref:DNase I-like protein n=1 Tax=Lentinula lateritia TaxID=40482 RepID=A0ABQ8VUQ9_9AGAR|nr:hypothetical protein C8R41DRAFT_914582 [Lentinula lateritia]
MANNDSQEYPVDYKDEYFSEVDFGNIEDQPSQEADQLDLDNRTAEWMDPTDPNSLLPTAIVSTPNSLDSRFCDLGCELRARLNTVSSHRQTSNQSAGNFAAAGGIVTMSLPTCLQVPSRRSHKLGSTSKPCKSRNSETALQPITYPQSSSLDQGSSKEMKVQQMHRLESNIVRLETLINRRVEDIQTSTASAVSSLRDQMLHDIQRETLRGSDRLTSTQAGTSTLTSVLINSVRSTLSPSSTLNIPSSKPLPPPLSNPSSVNNGCKIHVLSWNINGHYLLNYLSPDFLKIVTAYDVIMLQETRIQPSSTIRSPTGFTAHALNRRRSADNIENP